MTEQAESVRRAFFGNGVFDWQIPVGHEKHKSWDKFTFDTNK